MEKVKSILLALAVAIAGVGAMAGAVGAVSMVETPYNETVEVSEDSEEIRLTATNITSEGTGSAIAVEVFGVENETETSVATGTLDTSSSETDSYSYTGVNSSAYSSYKVSLTDGTDSTNATAEELVIEEVGVLGGGGGLLGDSGMSTGVVAVVGLGGLYVLMRRDN